MQLLTETQAATALGLKPATLRRWRWEGQMEPPYLKIGRAVRYSQEDIDDFLRAARCGCNHVSN